MKAIKTRGSVPVRILTHNIRYATSSPCRGEELWHVRKSSLVNELVFNTLHCQETLICLQEVLHSQLLDVLSGLNGPAPHEQMKELNFGGDWAYIGVGRDDGKTAGEYSPILYRPAVWEVKQSKTLWLSETPDRPSRGWDAACIRILTIVVFQHQQSRKKVVAMNTHLDHQGAKSRLEAARMILEQIEKYCFDGGSPEPLPVFLAGDFNSEVNDDAYRSLNGEGSPVQDLSSWVARRNRYGDEKTYTGFSHEDGPATRIDFLFIGPKHHVCSASSDDGSREKDHVLWNVLGYGVLPNRFEDGLYCSDHRAVIGDVLLF